MEPVKRKKRIISIAATVGGLAVVFFLLSSSFSSSVYEIQTKRDLERLVGKEVRLSGKVIPDTIEKDSQTLSITFGLKLADGNPVTIHYKGVVPDPFAANREVIVVGTLVSKEQLDAVKLTVKCPSKYKDKTLSPETYDFYRKKHGNPPQ